MDFEISWAQFPSSQEIEIVYEFCVQRIHAPVNVSHRGAGEVFQVSIISPEKDNFWWIALNTAATELPIVLFPAIMVESLPPHYPMEKSTFKPFPEGGPFASFENKLRYFTAILQLLEKTLALPGDSDLQMGFF